MQYARSFGSRVRICTDSTWGRVSRWGPTVALLSSAGLGPFLGAEDLACLSAVASVTLESIAYSLGVVLTQSSSLVARVRAIPASSRFR